MTEETVERFRKELEPLAYRARVAELVRGIEEAAAVEREMRGTYSASW